MKSCGKSNTRGDFCTPSTVRCRDDFLSFSLLFLSRPAGCIQAARLRFSQFCKKDSQPKSRSLQKKKGKTDDPGRDGKLSHTLPLAGKSNDWEPKSQKPK